jgi:hypothetical protein
MSKKASKKAPVDRATATIKADTKSDALKTSVTNTIAQAMQKSTNWGAATDVQSAVKVWVQGATDLATNATLIANLGAQLATAEAKQETLRRDWAAQKKAVVSSVTVFCGGSADMVQSFNLDVITHTRLGALPAPSGLEVNPGTVLGDVVAKWLKGIARHGFVVQHATDPTNQATISAPTPCTKVSFKLGGMPSGANVSFRVAAIDPTSATGISPWSAWVLGNAR